MNLSKSLKKKVSSEEFLNKHLKSNQKLLPIICRSVVAYLATHLFLQWGWRSCHPVVWPSACWSEPHPAALQEGAHDALVLPCSGDTVDADRAPASTTCCCWADWSEPMAGRRWSFGSEAGHSGWHGRDARSWWAELMAKHLLTCSHMQWSNRIPANDGI